MSLAVIFYNFILCYSHFLLPCSIHLGGVITEGYEKGFMELTPVPYNVVLEDDTYKGLIRVGLKFIVKVSMLLDNNPID